MSSSSSSIMDCGDNQHALLTGEEASSSNNNNITTPQATSSSAQADHTAVQQTVSASTSNNGDNNDNGDDDDDEEPPAAKRARMAPKCQVCNTQPSKYTCPGCSIKFCSLVCSKQHKSESKCTGERNPTQFVDLKQFDNNQLVRGSLLLYICIATTFRILSSLFLFDFWFVF